jgi:hypothetical protein
MRSAGGSIIFLLLMVLADLYVFQALKAVGVGWGSRTRAVVFSAYWLACAAGLAFVATFPYVSPDRVSRSLRTYLFATTVGFLLAQLVAIPFLLMDDLRRFGYWVGGLLLAKREESTQALNPNGITRSVFLSWMGLGVGTALFSSLTLGFRNKYNYQIRNVSLHFPNLPRAFRGLRMVHISDIHSGSFTDRSAVLRGVEMINDQRADVVVFTGDLVNDRSEEMLPFLDVFNQVKAPMGVFSTLGNHDYGDYVRWKSEAAKEDNLNLIKNIHEQLGWRLLLDEHVLLEKESEKIALIGVQNISGRSRFISYGSLAKAVDGLQADVPFRMLLSHDPSHWEKEVIGFHQPIDLTLSGHTHGMQFGVELPGFKWSPVKWVYKQWAGLYEMDNKRLYVNRGFGFIGYPGRVGIMPEITVIDFV